MTRPSIDSCITCPNCGYSKRESVTSIPRKVAYQCHCCGALLRTKAGKCCIHCCYGTVPCSAVPHPEIGTTRK
ncbi:MAG: GDCCVxC domain-containing (seleno)protein [Gammaproteobacteria bacterium]